MSLVEIQDEGLLVINDPLVSVSGLLAESRNHRSTQHQQRHPQNDSSRSDGNNPTSGMYLQRIWIEDDEIAQEIDQRPWKSLEIVSCQGSKLPQLVGTALRQPSLQIFTLRKIASQLEHCMIAVQISKLIHLQELTLEVALSERSARALGYALASTRFSRCSLRDLKLERCSFIIPSALSAFAEGLAYNTSLESLSLIDCRLKDDDLQELVSRLPLGLKSFDLTGNYCRHQLDTLLLHTKIVTLNLTKQHPGEFGGSLDISSIGPALASKMKLKSLDLSFNMFNLDEIRGLVDALASTDGSSLEYLNLMGNQLDDTAIQYIGKKLPRMMGLKRLDLSANRFGDDGAAALREGLRHNVTLCHLEMPRGFEKEDELRYLLALNRGGRRLLQPRRVMDGPEGDESPVEPKIQWQVPPLGLWPSVFERINRLSMDDNDITNVNMRASVTLFLLQEGPIWMGRDH